MLPFRRNQTHNLQAAGTSQNTKSNYEANLNAGKFDLIETNFDIPGATLHQMQDGRFWDNRSDTTRMNPVAVKMSPLVLSHQQIPSTDRGASTSQQFSGSIYALQPTNNFVSQWQNQQMAFGIMSDSGTAYANVQKKSRTVEFVSEDQQIRNVTAERRDMVLQAMPLPNNATQTRNFKFPLTAANTPALLPSTEKPNLPPNNSRHLIGSVEQVIRWNQIAQKKSQYITYSVYGTIESKYSNEQNTDMVIITLKQRGSDIATFFPGPSIQCVFYAIDRPPTFLDNLEINDNIVCVGIMKGARKMQVFNAWSDNTQLDDYKRISFLCQRALLEV